MVYTRALATYVWVDSLRICAIDKERVIQHARRSRSARRNDQAIHGIAEEALDVDTATRRLAELNAKVENPDLWNDADAAQKIMRERTELEDRLGALARFDAELEDAVTLVELGEAEADVETEQEGITQLKNLKAEAERRQVEALLSGEVDANDTYIEVHSGAGGTESCDWARMLFRMYARWAERHKFKVEIVEETPGDEAGIKSATLLVKGHNAHGWAKTEVRRASSRAYLAFRFQRAPAYELRVGLGLSGNR